MAEQLRAAVKEHDSELPDSGIRGELEKALKHHQACLSKADHAWHMAETGCINATTEKELESEQASCNKFEEELKDACKALHKTAAKAMVEGPEILKESATNCCAEWNEAEPKLNDPSWKLRVWPDALMIAGNLDKERETQMNLEKLLQVEAMRKNLLDAELVAPPDARRALATMRTLTSGAHSKSTLPSLDELSRQSNG
eukprot:TRINITY_DN19122_c0_g1_i2.p1 TRINITY_DN19122_c0_g1~~TRINITY_DN19122_c0_g1_i2.p1  ORF type:complete len:200 (+),score=58.46 TRINITY_DN19122_c0_g1_i2:147-746(+)